MTLFEMGPVGTVLDALPADVLAYWRIPERVRPSVWAQEHLRLPSETSALAGRYSLDMYPFWREPLDAWVDPEVRRLTLKAGTQLGKSTVLSCLITSCAGVDPGPTLVVGAVENSVKEFSVTRLYPMLRSCDETAPLMLPEHDQLDLFIELEGQLIFFGWSGSVSKLGEKSIRYLFNTEVDKWSREKSLEGDSLSLAENRIKGYPNSRELCEGSPSLVGQSRITDLYEASDQCTYRVPCPHCGEYQALIFGKAKESGGLRWPRGEDGHSVAPEVARREAWYECVHCAGRITDMHKALMMQAGLWVPQGCHARPATRAEVKAAKTDVREAYDGTQLILSGRADNPTRRHRGFHLSSLYSPMLTFGDVAAKWLEAGDDLRKRQDFFNGWLGLAWDMTPAELDWQKLAARCCDERIAGIVPDDVEVLIAAADVGKHRIHYVVRGWTTRGASWLVSYGECTTLAEFDLLTRQATWPMDSGSERAVDCALIDARYRTDEVRDFVAGAGPRVRAIMGDKMRYGTYKFFPVKASGVTGKPLKAGPGEWHLYSDIFKERLSSMQMRGEEHAYRWRLHGEVEENYLKQVTSEARREEKDRRGRPVWQWIVLRANHFWDCECYEVAGWEMWRNGWCRRRKPRRKAAHDTEGTRQRRREKWRVKSLKGHL